MNTAGLVFDIYDDSDRQILSAIFEEAAPPEKVASSSLLSPEELNSLPDHVFAVVADNGNGRPLRKYAMHDEPHLKLSVLYFCESGQLFPEETQKLAARNLVRGCRWYDVEPPEDLVKMAFVGVTKIADLTGSNIMPKGALKGSVAQGTAKASAPSVKTAASPAVTTAIADRFIDDTWEHAEDLSSFDTHTVVKKASYQRYCLPHKEKYPIDSYEHVQRADEYFHKHAHDFSLIDCRIYAQNLTNRADEIGVGVSEKVASYAGDGYGSFIEGELVKRASAYAGTGHEAGYRTLLDLQEKIPPAAMAVLIKEADDLTGASDVYGRAATGFMEPYRAVFGKEASAEEYSWVSPEVSTTGSQLSKLANESSGQLDEVFGSGFSDSFSRDPAGIFESMPDPQKALIAKMAAQA